MPGHGARVLLLELQCIARAQVKCPNLFSGTTNKRLCLDWSPCRGTKSERGLTELTEFLIIIITLTMASWSRKETSVFIASFCLFTGMYNRIIIGKNIKPIDIKFVCMFISFASIAILLGLLKRTHTQHIRYTAFLLLQNRETPKVPGFGC